LDELIRISELVKAAVKDKCPDLTLPKKLSDDESELWRIIQRINLEVQTKPFGREKNSLFATLAFDIALCSLYGLGTSVNETQSLEWLLFSANLGNELAMGMTVPLAFSINENEETKSWMRLHLGLSMLKGSHHSANYITKLFPDDCIALRRVIRKRFEGRNSTAENDRIKAQLDRWADHLDHLYNASTPSEPFDLDQGISLYLERCAAINGGLVPNDPHRPLGTDLAWTAKALYPPVLEARGTTISTTTRWISLYCFFLLFEQNTDNLVRVLDVLETQWPSDLTREMDVIPTNALNLLVKVYENPDMNLCYRLELGEKFKRRQIEMIQFLLNRGADPFRTVEEVCSHNDRMVSIINYAAVKGDSASISVLLKHGANLYSTQDVNGLPPFTRTLLQNGNVKTAALLLPKSKEERHRIFNIQNHRGYICFGTVLSAALNQNRGLISIETIKFLRDAGAMEFIVHPGENRNVFDVYFSYFSRGGDRKDLSSFDSATFAILLEAFHYPEQINARFKDTGMTLLQVAVWRADRRAVELLLQYGKLDINAETGEKATAFDIAAHRKRNPPEYVKEGGVREIRKFHNALSQIICLLRSRGAEYHSPHPEYFLNSMSEFHEDSSLSGTSIQIGPNGLPSISDMTKSMLHVFSDDFRRNPLILDLLRVKWPKRWTGSKTSGLLKLEDFFSSFISENLPQLSAQLNIYSKNNQE
jgi:ankyrin repeat protein